MRICLLPLALALGCGPELPTPTLRGVTPDWAYNGEATSVSLMGDSFYPEVQVDSQDRDDQIDAQFVVELIDGDSAWALEGVDLQDGYGQIDAVVPGGWPVGIYDLRLTSPSGAWSELEEAFTVTSTRADHLELDLTTSSFTVGELVSVAFHLEDPDDDPVAEPLPVTFTIDPAMSFVDLEGGDWIAGADGTTVSGRLDGDGTAQLTLKSDSTGSFSLSVEATDTESKVQGASQLLTFVPAELASVSVTLPDADFVATAGEAFKVGLAFQDEGGNVLEDEAATVVVVSQCGDFQEQVDVTGSTALDVTVTQASAGGCEEDAIIVYGPAVGVSDAFTTEPGAATSLELDVSRDTVVAGELIDMVVRGRDEWENLVLDYNERLLFEDTLGGLAAPFCEEGWVSGLLFCGAQLTVSGETSIYVTDENDTISGESIAIQVSAAEAVSLSITSDAEVAGEQYTLGVEALDTWGNTVSFDAAGGEPIAVTGEDTECVWEREVSGVQEMECVTTLAGEQTLQISVDGLGLAGSRDVVLVNNALTNLALGISADPATAGEALTLTATGSDEWGNPYVQQDAGAEILLEDSEGSLSELVTLDSAGAAETEVTLTGADAAVLITAYHNGDEVGDLTLEVLPGELDHLEVTLASAATWVGDAVALEVEALDAWENLIEDYEGAATASSQGALFEDAALEDFDGGVAEIALVWDAPGLADRVDVVGEDGSSGTSGSIDVLDADCASPPTAELQIDGGEDAVSCWITGISSASASADFSGSVPGGSLIERYLLWVDGELTALTATSTTIVAGRVGLLDVVLTVADADACGSTDEASWWVAPDDGSPAGPIDVSLSETSLIAGSPTSGQAQIDVSAYDCSGDLASNDLYARVDLGALIGGAETGEGLSWAVSKGASSFDWTVAAAVHTGEATVHVGAIDGSAYGAASLTVEGDSAHPTVRAVDPSGETEEILDGVSIQFTETLDESSLSASEISVTELSGDEIMIDEVALDDDGVSLELSFAESLDASEGSFTLLVGAGAVRDAGGGNRLDGAWTGGPSDLEVAFGAIGDEGISMSSCAADSEAFTPDGDDGADEQADAASISVEASAAPTWWELQALDADGALRWSWREAASSSAEVLSWDGRGDDGFVQATGAWTLQISAVDAYDNLSTPCEIELEILQSYRAP